MRGNSRIIALSLVAIVLGAGYLMRVIPPPADIDIADNDAVTIDGTVVTNPLNLAEIVPPAVAANQEQRLIAKNEPAPTNQPPADASLVSFPGDPLADIFLSPPAGSPSQETVEESTPTPEANSDLPPSQPSFESYPPLVPALADPNRSNPDSPSGGGGGGNPPTDTPEEPDGGDPAPDIIIELPTDPRPSSPTLPIADVNKPFEPRPDFGLLNPLPQSDDHPTHQVPDSGSTLALVALSIAAIAALRRVKG